MARVGENRVGTALAKHGYKELKKVGEGSFGAAILAQHNSDKDKDTKAIVKMIDISRASKSEKDDALKESQVLSSLKHPYIVRYRESFHEDGWLCIVMDYAEGGDLSDKLKKTRAAGKTIPQDQVLRWFTQSILALKYIHDMHILHRDLKSGNFFLSKSGNIKMGDFGIAKVLECTAACAQTQIGTPYYLSPEICKGKPYAWSSDIWSMGCILYEMCARKVPFDAPDLRQLIQKITKGPAPEVPSEYSVAMRNLCKELLDLDPVKRPPAADILKKPVVQEMVRRMLDEVKGDEEPASGEKSGGGAASAKPAPKTGTVQKYQKNDAVEYYSETHGEWLPASITNVEDSGRVQLNVKPGVWLSVEVQTAKVRPRQNGGGAAPAQQSANDARPPAGPAAASGIGGASPSQPTRAAAAARESSGRRGNDPPQQAGGVRAASPRRDTPQSRERGSSQDRGAPRRSSTPQRQGSGQTPAAAGAPTSSRGASPMAAKS
jgi:NIMA (never in mitosis gene a)-related kinase